MNFLSRKQWRLAVLDVLVQKLFELGCHQWRLLALLYVTPQRLYKLLNSGVSAVAFSSTGCTTSDLINYDEMIC
jgi:hypothetical protein